MPRQTRSQSQVTGSGQEPQEKQQPAKRARTRSALVEEEEADAAEGGGVMQRGAKRVRTVGEVTGERRSQRLAPRSPERPPADDNAPPSLDHPHSTPTSLINSSSSNGFDYTYHIWVANAPPSNADVMSGLEADGAGSGKEEEEQNYSLGSQLARHEAEALRKRRKQREEEELGVGGVRYLDDDPKWTTVREPVVLYPDHLKAVGRTYRYTRTTPSPSDIFESIFDPAPSQAPSEDITFHRPLNALYLPFFVASNHLLQPPFSLSSFSSQGVFSLLHPVDNTLLDLEVEDLPEHDGWREILEPETYDEEGTYSQGSQSLARSLSQSRACLRLAAMQNEPRPQTLVPPTLSNLPASNAGPSAAPHPQTSSGEAEISRDRSASPEILDLRRPAPPLPAHAQPHDRPQAFDRTTFTTLTTQQDTAEDISSESASSSLATGRRGNGQPPAVPAEASAEPAMHRGKQVRPLPMQLSGIDLPAQPLEPEAQADTVGAAAGRGGKRGRGRGTAQRGAPAALRGRGGGAGASSANPLARVRADVAVENLVSGNGREKAKQPLKVILSQFELHRPGMVSGAGRSAKDESLVEDSENEVVPDSEEVVPDSEGVAEPGSEDVIPDSEDVVMGDDLGGGEMDVGGSDMMVMPGAARTASPEAMDAEEGPKVGGRATLKGPPSLWKRIQDVFPEPHTVPVCSDPPDFYSTAAPFKIQAIPSHIRHPFHPTLEQLISERPGLRVKWIIPISGQVTIPNLSPALRSLLSKEAKRTGKKIAAFVCSHGSVAFPDPKVVDGSDGQPTSNAIKWTPEYLLQLWRELLQVRKLGRYGPVSFALTGPQPDPFRPGLHPLPPLSEHLHLPPGLDTAMLDPPVYPEVGIHIKLFCDLEWALQIRHLLGLVQLSASGATTAEGGGTVGESAALGTSVGGSVGGAGKRIFLGKKLCLVGERGEVLYVA